MITTDKKITSRIDHTFLKANITGKIVDSLCKEAVEYEFASVCIPPYFVKKAAQMLTNEKPRVCTVVGFPFGYSCTPSKVEEARKAIDEGANEIDMVVNLAAVKDQNWNFVFNDLQTVAVLTQMRGALVKVIIETPLLVDDEIKKLCEICMKVNVDYIKTCTGFAGPVEMDSIEVIKHYIDDSIKIKASGGINSKSFVNELINAGVSRIGTSSAIKIIS
ncbi:MAG: deoxyribose-phosphate aldolase [Chitinophagales bacterium]|nr:deoxyribose-phosphate aldolase [Chitinophagales bacterium]